MLPPEMVGRIKERHELGFSVQQIAAKFKVNPKTVYSVLKRKNHDREPRPASEAMLKRRRILKLLAKKKRQVNGRVMPWYGSVRALVAGLANEHGITASCATVVRDMDAIGMKSYVRPAVPALGKEHHARRFKFCKKWAKANVEKLVFSDEHWETTNDSTQRTMYATKRTAVIPRQQKNRLCVPRVMIWGAIGVGWRSQLVFCKDAGPGVKKPNEVDETLNVNSQRYIKLCLSKIVPEMQRRSCIYMHDGAKAHTSKRTTAYLAGKKVRVMEGWPSHSPDLNPIEKLWGFIKKRVSELAPRTLEELKATVKKVWNDFPQDTIDNLVRGFGKKCKICISRNGAC